MENPQPEKSGKTFNFIDVFGFGKIMEIIFHKIPLNKLSSRMAYCMAAAFVIMVFAATLAITGTKVHDFPTGWDIRIMLVVSVIFLFIGIWDVINKK